jgi:hypothetical protein
MGAYGFLEALRLQLEPREQRKPTMVTGLQPFDHMAVPQEQSPLVFRDLERSEHGAILIVG